MLAGEAMVVLYGTQSLFSTLTVKYF